MHAFQGGSQQRYGSAEHCAAYLGCAKSWFLEHVAPQLRAVTVGRRRLYSFAEIDAWWAKEAAGGGRPGQEAPSAGPRRGGRPRRVV